MGQKLAKKIRDRRADEKVHDRRATDTLAAGQYGPVEVDDPMEPGAKLTVLRQLRNDPLARLHDHHQIDEAQFHAGRAYQADWEAAERGAQAIDPTKEYVDGGSFPEPLTDRQAKARKRLGGIRYALGHRMHKVVHAFLIEGNTVEQIMATKEIVWPRRPSGDRWANYYGKMLRDALDILAVEYKLAM